jgi:hypothetical protein
MSEENINFILNTILDLELDEEVYVKDIINTNYIPDIVETIHVIMQSLQN